MGGKTNKPKARISGFLNGPHDLQIARLLWVKDCALEVTSKYTRQKIVGLFMIP
jgi:hypothetical protein